MSTNKPTPTSPPAKSDTPSSSMEDMSFSKKKRKPTSLKKVLANISNSKKSTGPTSKEGKIRSSQNAVIHALYAETPVLMFESAKEREELAEIVTSNLRPFTPAQQFKVGLIIARLWWIRRMNRINTAFIDHEITTEVLNRKFPAKGITFKHEDDWDIRREELLSQHSKNLSPTERDVQNVLHRLLEGRNDLILKMDKMSIRNERELTRLLDDFDRLQKDERQAMRKANGGYDEPRLNEPSFPWEEEPWTVHNDQPPTSDSGREDDETS